MIPGNHVDRGQRVAAATGGAWAGGAAGVRPLGP